MKLQEVKTGFTSGPTEYPAHPRQGIFEASVTQKHDLGARYIAKDGRVFRYARAGATELGVGKLQQGAAFGGSSATVQADLTVQADAAIGATSLFITLATDAATLNQYAGGYCAIGDDAGEGQLFGIVGNSVASGGGTCRIDLDRPILIAVLITTSLVQIMTNPYNLVVEAATTPTGLTLGVTQLVVPINYYCWLQTWGMCCCRVKTAGLMGVSAIRDVAEAGSIGVQTAGAGSLVNTEIGEFPSVVATTLSGLVFLKIAP